MCWNEAVDAGMRLRVKSLASMNCQLHEESPHLLRFLRTVLHSLITRQNDSRPRYSSRTTQAAAHAFQLAPSTSPESDEAGDELLDHTTREINIRHVHLSKARELQFLIQSPLNITATERSTYTFISPTSAPTSEIPQSFAFSNDALIWYT
jgi:hypothetical protein